MHLQSGIFILFIKGICFAQHVLQQKHQGQGPQQYYREYPTNRSWAASGHSRRKTLFYWKKAPAEPGWGWEAEVWTDWRVDGGATRNDKHRAGWSDLGSVLLLMSHRSRLKVLRQSWLGASQVSLSDSSEWRLEVDRERRGSCNPNRWINPY